jgi:hypothetical protein
MSVASLRHPIPAQLGPSREAGYSGQFSVVSDGTDESGKPFTDKTLQAARTRSIAALVRAQGQYMALSDFASLGDRDRALNSFYALHKLQVRD